MTPVVFANSAGISVSNQPLAPEELRKINAACRGLGFLGLKLNDTANTQGPSDRDIGAPESTARVLIIRAQEDWRSRENVGIR